MGMWREACRSCVRDSCVGGAPAKLACFIIGGWKTNESWGVKERDIRGWIDCVSGACVDGGELRECVALLGCIACTGSTRGGEPFASEVTLKRWANAFCQSKLLDGADCVAAYLYILSLCGRSTYCAAVPNLLRKVCKEDSQNDSDKRAADSETDGVETQPELKASNVSSDFDQFLLFLGFRVLSHVPTVLHLQPSDRKANFNVARAEEVFPKDDDSVCPGGEMDDMKRLLRGEANSWECLAVRLMRCAVSGGVECPHLIARMFGAAEVRDSILSHSYPIEITCWKARSCK